MLLTLAAAAPYAATRARISLCCGQLHCTQQESIPCCTATQHSALSALLRDPATPSTRLRARRCRHTRVRLAAAATALRGAVATAAAAGDAADLAGALAVMSEQLQAFTADCGAGRVRAATETSEAQGVWLPGRDGRRAAHTATGALCASEAIADRCARTACAAADPGAGVRLL